MRINSENRANQIVDNLLTFFSGLDIRGTSLREFHKLLGNFRRMCTAWIKAYNKIMIFYKIRCFYLDSEKILASFSSKVLIKLRVFHEFTGIKNTLSCRVAGFC